MRLAQTRLLVTRFDACFEFYRDQLGLKVNFGEPGGVYADFDTGGTLAIFDRSLMAQVVGTAELPADAQSQDRTVLSLQVDQVDETYAQLKERGVAFLNEPHDQQDWGIRVVQLRDPDGNLIELHHNLPMTQ